MTLSGKEKRALRARAHPLRPVVTVGARGVTPTLLAELDQALEAHELIKVRINAGDRDERARIIQTMCEGARAEKVQAIGHLAILFRKTEQHTDRD